MWWPIVVYVVTLVWLSAVAIATTKCGLPDLSIVTANGIFALFITLVIALIMHKEK
jgi:hypothetical protein